MIWQVYLFQAALKYCYLTTTTASNVTTQSNSYWRYSVLGTLPMYDLIQSSQTTLEDKLNYPHFIDAVTGPGKQADTSR